MTTDQILVDHRIMGGVACIRGTRIPVSTVVGLVAEGMTAADTVAEYPKLTAHDVRAALEFAANAVSERHVPLQLPA